MTEFSRGAKKIKTLTFEELFQAYCSMDPISNAADIELLPLSQIDKWLAKAKILDMKNVTTTDTGVCFFKFRKRAIDYEEFHEYINELARFKNLDPNEIKDKLLACNKPSDEEKKKSISG